jgi:hypothetical protein
MGARAPRVFDGSLSQYAPSMQRETMKFPNIFMYKSASSVDAYR